MIIGLHPNFWVCLCYIGVSSLGFCFLFSLIVFLAWFSRLWCDLWSSRESCSSWVLLQVSLVFGAVGERWWGCLCSSDWHGLFLLNAVLYTSFPDWLVCTWVPEVCFSDCWVLHGRNGISPGAGGKAQQGCWWWGGRWKTAEWVPCHRTWKCCSLSGKQVTQHFLPSWCELCLSHEVCRSLE